MTIEYVLGAGMEKGYGNRKCGGDLGGEGGVGGEVMWRTGVEERRVKRRDTAGAWAVWNQLRLRLKVTALELPRQTLNAER